MDDIGVIIKPLNENVPRACVLSWLEFIPESPLFEKNAITFLLFTRADCRQIRKESNDVFLPTNETRKRGSLIMQDTPDLPDSGQERSLPVWANEALTNRVVGYAETRKQCCRSSEQSRYNKGTGCTWIFLLKLEHVLPIWHSGKHSRPRGVGWSRV
jgi:hypothetical protein